MTNRQTNPGLYNLDLYRVTDWSLVIAKLFFQPIFGVVASPLTHHRPACWAPRPHTANSATTHLITWLHVHTLSLSIYQFRILCFWACLLKFHAIFHLHASKGICMSRHAHKKSVNLQYNTLGCLDNGTNELSTKRLIFQVFFFFMISFLSFFFLIFFIKLQK